MEVLHVEIRGFPETETSEELLQSPPEALSLAFSLRLVSLSNSGDLHLDLLQNMLLTLHYIDYDLIYDI